MYVIGLDDTVILDVVITNDDTDFIYIRCTIPWDEQVLGKGPGLSPVLDDC